MFKLLFGNENIERILFYLLVNNKCYGKKLSETFSVTLSSMQRSLQKLERLGLLRSFYVGKTKIYEFNPRYPFLSEIKIFLKKAYSFLPEETQKKYYQPPQRKRTRKTGNRL